MRDEDRSKRKNIILIAVAVIILIALWIIIPNIPGLIDFEEDDEGITKEYSVIESENVTTFKNDRLDVSLSRIYSGRGNRSSYEAKWVNTLGNFSEVSGRSPDDLYDELIKDALKLTKDQIKWYEYMVQRVL